MPQAHGLHYDPKYFPDPTEFKPERFLDRNDPSDRANMRTFGKGPRACLGQNLAQNELMIFCLMTMRDFEFECYDLKPNEKPRVAHTNLDTIYGDIIFQELGMEAKPRGPSMMRVRRVK